MPRRQTQAGNTFIEVCVILSLVAVLLGMVVMMVPLVDRESYFTDSINNVRHLAMALLMEKSDRAWPPYDGKDFVLSLVPSGAVDARNVDNLRVFFSRGDTHLDFFKMKDAGGAARYAAITFEALEAGGAFQDLTSYAGRRNADPRYALPPGWEGEVVPIVCDDDQGNLHHPKGLVMAYSDGSARFVKWRDLDMAPPEEIEGEVRPFLGDAASGETLRGLSD